MGFGENYIAFGIVCAITGFWHAASLLLILQNDAAGWLFGAFSISLIWGMKGYIKGLYRPVDRRRLVRLLILCQAVSEHRVCVPSSPGADAFGVRRLPGTGAHTGEGPAVVAPHVLTD